MMNHVIKQKIVFWFLIVLVSGFFAPSGVKADIMGDLPQNKVNRRPKILTIKIEGNKATESNAIKNIIKSKAGYLYSSKVVAQDIKTLWRLKKFNDIEFRKEKTKKGVILHIKVVEKRTIRSIIVHGNSKLGLEEVNKVVTIKPNTILDESAVKDNVIKIKQRYQKDGFYLINIKHKIKRVKNNKVDIHYYIEEGPRVKVGGVSFSGNKRFPSEKLRSGISTRVPGIFSFLNDTDGVFDKNALDVDILKIKSLYFNHGYVRAKVGPSRIQFSSAQNKVYIHIPILEGPRYKIKEISFGGTLLSPDKELMKRYKAGDKEAKQKLLEAHHAMVKSKGDSWFNRGQMAMDLKRITTYYRDLGYAYANVIPQSPINDVKREISVKFIIKPGKKVYIERIEIQGNTSTRDKVIRREMIINEGDLFSVTRLDISKKRITRLGYFKKVEIKQKKGSDTDKIRVIVKIQERSTGTFNIGAGFSTVENFIAQAQITQRNFLGRGQTMMLRAALSSLRQYFTLQFTEPHFFDTDWYFSFRLYNSIYAFESFNRETYGGALTWGYSLTPFWRVLLTYKLEDVAVDTSNSGGLFGTSSYGSHIPSTAYVANLFDDGITSSVRGLVSWDHRNNRLFPTKGWLANASVEVARPEIASQNVFTKYRANARFYYPIYGPFVLKMNSQIGYITSPLKSGVPIFERYFLGGINTIRGFRPYSIGPRIKVPISPDPNAALFSFKKGGNKSLIFNWELEFEILKAMMIKGVVFIDAGNAYDDDENYSLTNMRSSWGFGIRWYTFLGILRFEWGLPFNPRDGEDPIVFEFNIGNSF